MPTNLRIVFTGNVVLKDTLYDPDEVNVRVLRALADSEFPAVVTLRTKGTTVTKTAAIVAAVNAVLSVLVLLGAFNLTADQLAGIGVAINAVLVAGAALFDPNVPFGRTQ